MRHVFVAALSVGPFLLGNVVSSRLMPTQEQAPADAAKKADARIPEPLKLPGIENSFRLSPRLYSGGDPQSAESFAALKQLGIRTIISVDGAQQNVDEARKVGIRYVHLPIGYDGVPNEQALKLVQAIKSLPGPVYVHCHHGKHRGPAAAAVCGISTEGWSKEQAMSWMKTAGTSPDYRGLFASVGAFEPPSPEVLAKVSADFPERAPVPALVEAMLLVDQRWDNLKAVQKAGFRAPENQPDLDPPHEALQLVELYRELQRSPEALDHGADFLNAAKSAEKNAEGLEKATRDFTKSPTAESRQAVDAAFRAAGASCTQCHGRFRDNRPH